MLVFIYGTLRAGEANHGHMAGARYVGPARTLAQFTLVDLGEFPALVEGGADVVHGELYEVAPDHLERLDVFEGHPDLYVRRPVALEGGAEAFAYLPRDLPDDAPRIPGGDWKRR